MLWRVQIVLILKFLNSKKLKLIVDSTMLPVANTNKARTQKIKRFSGQRERETYTALIMARECSLKSSTTVCL
ncbi:MAG: hypothetical protein RMJ51_01785 [Candidatus Calescibacterium sp.]|nr:hypothetical protein [Candidatus Calescibacterium sp.]MDW8194959.1 hypothetical protein [Candidatus Calescibacterium sp.]